MCLKKFSSIMSFSEDGHENAQREQNIHVLQKKSSNDIMSFSVKNGKLLQKCL